MKGHCTGFYVRLLSATVSFDTLVMAVPAELCFIQAKKSYHQYHIPVIFFKSSGNSGRRLRGQERADVSGGGWSGGGGYFVGCFSCRLCLFEKVKNLMVGPVLSCFTPQVTDLEIYSIYVHTNMHAVSVRFRNPLNYDMDYKICMIFSCMKCIHACSVCLYLFHKTEWLTFSLWVGGWGLGFGGLRPPFFIGGNPWAPFYEIGSTLEPWRHTLHDYLSNLSLRNSS